MRGRRCIQLLDVDGLSIGRRIRPGASRPAPPRADRAGRRVGGGECEAVGGGCGARGREGAKLTMDASEWRIHDELMVRFSKILFAFKFPETFSDPSEPPHRVPFHLPAVV